MPAMINAKTESVIESMVPVDHGIAAVVAGCYATGSLYPNGQVTSDILVRELGLSLVDCGVHMSSSTQPWAIAAGTMGQKIRALTYYVLGSFFSLIRVLARKSSKRRVVYVRYPALGFMFLASFLPRSLRPACYVDAFISVWEATFVDRALGDRRSFGSRLVRWAEYRGLHAARYVLVDTEANRRFLSNLHHLPIERIHALPLGVEEHRWIAPLQLEHVGFTILYVGTFVPLHGVSRITEAIELLHPNPEIKFVFVGDGQDRSSLESLITRRPDLPITWHRGLYDPEQLARFVAEADVCLGIFGGEGKAARVLPYKMYLYLCLGKPTITQAQMSTPDETQKVPAVLVDGSAVEIAGAIDFCFSNRPFLRQLAHQSRDFFLKNLSNKILAKKWTELLESDRIILRASNAGQRNNIQRRTNI